MIPTKFDLFVLQLAEKLAAECKRRMQAWNGNYNISNFIMSSSSCVLSFSSVFTESNPDSNGWTWNVEVTDVCETQSIALATSLDKPRPFVFKLSSLQLF